MTRILAIVLVIAPHLAFAQLDTELLESFSWRSVGPAGAGGRIVDVEVVGEFPYSIFVGAATGGLWRSTNNGVTWEALFDEQDVNSIGAIAVHPNNPDVIWVGTGEANPRNSVSWGNGVYKSTDGGESWENQGLEDTHHIGRIVIDPADPQTVFVAALGHVWAPNEERGLYRTTDGGERWEHALDLGPETGVIDVAMDPRDSSTLYAAAWEVQRDGYSGGDPEKMTGPGSALYKSTDEGRSFRKLSKGLPKSELGRIGVAVAASDPEIVYAIVQTETTVPPPRDPEDTPPPEKDKTAEDGGVFRSTDRGETWEWVNEINPRPFYYSQIRVDPNDPDRVYVLGSPLSVSENGGEDFERMRINVHVDHHDLWISPGSSDHLVLGNDGGIYFSFDRGKTWDFLNQIALGQFYAIDVDLRDPYYIYGGVQDYCSWRGPSGTRNEIGITTHDWHKVMTGDGFQVRVDPSAPNILYAEAQYGRIIRHDLGTGQNQSITPVAPEGEEDYRFNWDTPLHISEHDPTTLYVGGNHVFRSRDRGRSWEVLSPDLTTATRSRMDYKDGVPQMIASITTLEESPLDPGLFYAGTDDGHVHVSRDDGKSWDEITGQFADMPGQRWVSRLVASRHVRERAYASFDGHRNDDFAPHLYVTEDTGRSWRSIAANLPEDGPVRVVREDTDNPNLLFVGTEFGAFVSIDRGGHWTPLMSGMPTVAVADMVVHPRERDLIAGTHGRSAFVMDIRALGELSDGVLAKDRHLFSIGPAEAFRYRVYSDDQFLGEKRFVAENPPYGATITYYVKERGDEEGAKATIAIENQAGDVVRELEGPSGRGIHRVQWDLRHEPPAQDESEGRGFSGALRGALALPGEYTVRVTVAGGTETGTVTVEPDAELQITDAERTERWDAVMKLVSLRNEAHERLETARAIHEQLQEMAEEIDAVEEAAETSRALEHQLDHSRSLVTRLYRSVEGSPLPPTTTELRRLEELEARLARNAEALEEMTATTLPALESTLAEQGIGRIRIPRKE